MAHPRVAAGALFFDDQDRVLLVKPTYKAGWDVPGGYVEPGETPVEACQREVKEELGLDRQVGRLLVVDWAPSDKEGDKVLFVFDGGPLLETDLSEVVLQSDELSHVSFHTPANLANALDQRLTRRITHAIEAKQSGQCRYLEHGTALDLPHRLAP
jgi:ADP-ribose pyrophosphatase YjhB (NUDIX family)